MCSVNQLSEQLPARPREGAHCRLEERSEEDQRKKEAKEKRTGQQGTETGKVVNPTTLFQQDFLSSPEGVQHLGLASPPLYFPFSFSGFACTGQN